MPYKTLSLPFLLHCCCRSQRFYSTYQWLSKTMEPCSVSVCTRKHQFCLNTCHHSDLHLVHSISLTSQSLWCCLGSSIISVSVCVQMQWTPMCFVNLAQQIHLILEHICGGLFCLQILIAATYMQANNIPPSSSHKQECIHVHLLWELCSELLKQRLIREMRLMGLQDSQFYHERTYPLSAVARFSLSTVHCTCPLAVQ